MSRLLSQAEVDSLLSSFGSEEAGLAGSDAVPYDLRAPLLLAGERLSLVHAACERLAGEVAGALSTILVASEPLRAEFCGLIQQPAGTVLATLVQGEPLGLFIDETGEAVGGISFQHELALAIVDRLQGGEGRLAAPRALSAVESRLLEEAFQRLGRALGERSALAPLHPGGLDPEPDFGRLVRRGGMLAAAAFRLELAGGEAVCRLLMTPLLAGRLASDAPRPAARDAAPELLLALRRAPVTLEPVLAGASLRVTDLQRLRPGHVLQLDLPEPEGVGLRLNGALLAEGVLRRQDARRVLEIRRFVPAAAGAEGREP